MISYIFYVLFTNELLKFATPNYFATMNGKKKITKGIHEVYIIYMQTKVDMFVHIIHTYPYVCRWAEGSWLLLCGPTKVTERRLLKTTNRFLYIINRFTLKYMLDLYLVIIKESERSTDRPQLISPSKGSSAPCWIRWTCQLISEEKKQLLPSVVYCTKEKI